MTTSSTPLISLSLQFYRVLLNLYPRPFREEYEREMVIVFHDSLRAVQRTGNALEIFRYWLTTLIDLAATAFRERFFNNPGPIPNSRKLGIGLIAGMAGGLVAGLAARLSMRGVALAVGLPPTYSGEGTFVIALIGAILGTPLGLVYLAVRNFLPGTGIWKGLTFGLLLFVTLMAPPLLFYREGEFLLVSPFIGISLFAPVAFIYGGVAALTVQRLEKNLSRTPTPAPQPRPTLVWSAILGQVFNLILFAVVLELAVLGTLSILNHLPRIPPLYVQVAWQVGLPFTALRDVNLWLINLTTMGYFGLASFIFWQRTPLHLPRLTGLALFLFGGALFNTGAAYYQQLIAPETLRPIFNLGQVLGVTALLALLYFFPTGRPASTWTLLLALVWLAFVIAWSLMPLSEPFILSVISAFFATGLLTQLHRYRLAPPPQRLQLRAPLIGFVIAIAGFSCVALAILIAPDLKLPQVDGLAVTATFGLYMLPWLFIPLSISWAMRRHRLWASQ